MESSPARIAAPGGARPAHRPPDPCPDASPRTSPGERATVAETILRQLAARSPDASICPSEVARALWPDDWRPRMAEVRAVAAVLVEQGQVVATRGPDAVDVLAPGGPVRLRRGPGWIGPAAPAPSVD
ncbi:DUF3253 domain-containing protein [Arsenicicoccus dermatophilus]|uniref:DUF3253 domain-containing protein n=1 Tax=Arsenicicoccus dermatophilus TaxID=1076331 RepID=UPI001F4CE4BD|nr:DUF3253 domain-containing protein [Arsenicicoccus dermatophilus]